VSARRRPCTRARLPACLPACCCTLAAGAPAPAPVPLPLGSCCLPALAPAYYAPLRSRPPCCPPAGTRLSRSWAPKSSPFPPRLRRSCTAPRVARHGGRATAAHAPSGAPARPGAQRSRGGTAAAATLPQQPAASGPAAPGAAGSPGQPPPHCTTRPPPLQKPTAAAGRGRGGAWGGGTLYLHTQHRRLHRRGRPGPSIRHQPMAQLLAFACQHRSSLPEPHTAARHTLVGRAAAAAASLGAGSYLGPPAAFAAEPHSGHQQRRPGV